MMIARRLILSVFAAVAGVLVCVSVPALAAAEAPETPAPVAVEVPGASSAVFHGELNPGKTGAAGTYELDTYQFLYAKSPAQCEEGQRAPESPGMSLGGGQEALPPQDVSGLEPGTEYTVCLRASNGGEETAVSAPVSFTTPSAPPSIGEESVLDVASSSVTLQTEIDPEGADTHYYFQYGTSTSYGAEAPVAPGVDIGSTDGEQTLSQHIQGLEPGTLYHYQVVAVQGGKAFPGEDETFTTQAAGGEFVLPDGREWEMVSPPDKYDARIEPIQEGGVVQAAADGSAITYFATAPTESSPQGYPNQVQVMSRRGVGGWSSLDIAPPHREAIGYAAGQGQEYRFFSSDLSLGVLGLVAQFEPALSPEASERTAYLVDTMSRSYMPLVTGCVPAKRACPPAVAEHANVPSGTEFGVGAEGDEPTFEIGTEDLRHVILGSKHVALTADTTGEGNFLYEWTAGHLQFVGDGYGARAVSSDGSRVVFGSEQGGVKELVLRNVVEGVSVRLDGVQGGSGVGPSDPVFWSASADGSRVLFTDTRALTADAGAGEHSADLYECEIVVVAGEDRCDLRDLTPLGTSPGHVGEHASVVGVLGSSADGSWVYFAANGVLAAGGEPGGCSTEDEFASGASCDVYVSHAGVTRLVAKVSAGDQPDWNDIELTDHVARVSPDGEWLVFMSRERVTGYNNRDAVSGKADEEVYLYHAAGGGAVSCVSCNSTGERPSGAEYGPLTSGSGGLVGGDRVWDGEQWVAGNVPGWTPYASGVALYESRFLSDDGRVFFNSSDGLVPQDVNGTEDVYEFEPAGVGTCTESEGAGSGASLYVASEHGCVGLISSGASPEESAFLDASESGGDVFFLTSAKLSSEDVDTARDVYDAHECTAAVACFPPSVVQSPACSTSDSCKAAPSLQPAIFGAPASATLSASGNPVAPVPKPVVTSRSSTRAQKLSRALRACLEKRGKQRSVCERQARRRYAAPGQSGKGSARKGARG